jgi:hypothetical protein
MLKIAHGFVTYIYVRSILLAMLVQNFGLSCLLYVLFLAFCSDQCLFEKLMLAFVDFFLRITQYNVDNHNTHAHC